MSLVPLHSKAAAEIVMDFTDKIDNGLQGRFLMIKRDGGRSRYLHREEFTRSTYLRLNFLSYLLFRSLCESSNSVDWHN